LTVEILCTMSLFLRFPVCLTASTKTVNSKVLELWQEHRWFIHHNHPAHPALYAEVSSENRTPVIPQLPYSSDLSPVSFSCFQTWQLV
jgi:hypothetical protein